MSTFSFKFIQRLLTPVPIDAPIAAGDRVDEALNKLQGQIDASGVPTYILPGETYTVEENTQALFRKRIKLGSGARIQLKGILVGV